MPPVPMKKRRTNTFKMVITTLKVEEFLILNSITIVHRITITAAAGLRIVNPMLISFSQYGESSPHSVQK